jgi:hypothetical protein
VGAANTYRANYNVTNYFWFDLRDADSGSPNFQQQYGLLRDDYTPKPAFDSYRRLVSKLSLRAKATVRLRVRCYRRGVFAQLRGAGAARATRVRFQARGRTAVDGHHPFGRHIRLLPTSHRERIEVRAAVRFGPWRSALERSIRCRVRAQ